MARMLITADIWAMVTERGEAAQLAIGVLVDMREILCLIVIPFTSSSATWNGEIVTIWQLTTNSLLLLTTANPPFESSPRT